MLKGCGSCLHRESAAELNDENTLVTYSCRLPGSKHPGVFKLQCTNPVNAIDSDTTVPRGLCVLERHLNVTHDLQGGSRGSL